MPGYASLRPIAPILIGASVMLSLAMGLRQSLGLFMQPAVKDLSIAVADFTLAIAIQNLAWGFLQPIAGALAVRVGYRKVMLAGGVVYAAGLLVMATAQGALGIMLGAGVLIGMALACTASSLAMAVAAKVAPSAMRSTVLGIVSAAGSVGAMIAAPIGQLLLEGWGWRVAVLGFFAIALVIIPAAWISGRADAAPTPVRQGSAADNDTAKAAARAALRHPPFMIMTCAYFICGLQLVFLTTHLPSYLELCGMDPMLSAQALAVIGGANILGSLFFGWAGGRLPKGVVLGALYFTRSLILLGYFIAPPTPTTTLVFAALIGSLWLGVVPLVSGMVVEMFGLRWQAMIQGMAFTSHQLGSFAGAFGGGLLYDMFGSYDMAWKIGVTIGLVAGTVQMIAGLPKRPTQGPMIARA